MTLSRLPRSKNQDKKLWDLHYPEAEKKIKELGLDPKKITMQIEHVFVEPWLNYWDHRCKLCKDVVPHRDCKICDTCEKYQFFSEFERCIHFVLDNRYTNPARVIFYVPGSEPIVTKRSREPRKFLEI